MDAGELELHLEEASLQDACFRYAGEHVGRRPRPESFSLLGTVNDELKPVVMDTRRVQRVMYNLVQNSIRHTPTDGTIHIRAEDAGEVVQVQVADTGEGIPETEITAPIRAAPTAPTGRGRALVRRRRQLGLSTAPRGSFRRPTAAASGVESAEGQGSTFSFTTLPQGPSSATAG